jgi:uncharacterized membrane protein SpoIIM required for sporulation
MTQQGFEQAHREEWEALALWLEDPKEASSQRPHTDFPALYRRVCHHLALARARMYSPALISELHHLVLGGHDLLYRTPSHTLGRVLELFTVRFPRQVRREWRLLALSTALFFGPLLSLLIVLQYAPEMVYTVLEPAHTVELEKMYAPGKDKLGRERDADSDFLMFGFYIYNNTSIGFRTFASGLLLGIGTLFVLVYNGLVIGAAAGHLTAIGYNTTFWSFVAGHSAFELTAIVLSGTAGLRLGLSLLSPGRASRLRALREAAAQSVPVVAGAALLFLLAAFIEAFWSSTTWPEPELKYTVGIALWVLTILFFVTAGRRHAP